MNTRIACVFGLALSLVACAGELEPQPESADRDDALAHRGDVTDDAASDEATPEADPIQGTACEEDETQACELDGEPGTRACTASSGWSACAVGECAPGDMRSCGFGGLSARCYRNPETNRYEFYDNDCNTPLVLAFQREAVTFTHPSGSFDVVGSGASHDTDWVSAATPWLALDVDGNGRIDDGAELFGSMTRLPNGTRARQGFEALAALDDDHDGRITPRDAAFARLLVWRDADQNRTSSARELTSAQSEGLVAIELGYRVDRRCTGTACEVERASFTFRSAAGIHEGDVVDVHFAVR